MASFLTLSRHCRALIWLSLVPLPLFAGGARVVDKQQHRVILCNDGGTLAAPDMEAPIGVAGLVRETIDPLRDTTINTLYWQLGTDPFYGTATARLSDWYSHNTKVGAIWGQNRASFKTAGEWRIYENAHTINETGKDTAAQVVEAGHAAGIDVFLSLRVNDGHDWQLKGQLNDPNMVPLKREHQDWLIGPDASRLGGLDGTLSDHSRYVYNFGLPEVRKYILSLVTEAINNYDLDGFDIDFDRQPALFKKEEAVKNTAVLTELLGQMKEALKAKSQAAGRPLYLSVRVPPSLEEMRKIGLDVSAWIKNGIVDIVVVGDPRGWNYRLPIEDFVALAKGTNCKIIAQDLCAFREDRGRSSRVLFGEKTYYSTEQFRAVAAKHWQAGADGQYIWNQHFLKFSADDKFDRQHWKEIGDRALLEHLDKHYLVGPKGHGGSLPFTLAQAGESAKVNLEIADDPEKARDEGYPVKVVLRCQVEQLTRVDQVDFELNGATLDRSAARVRLNYNDCWLDFDVTKLIKKGDNAFAVHVRGRNPKVEAPLVLSSVEALVSYK
jgi:hypothetical protein